MSDHESQCYFIQLQIDGYLDGDLSTAQQDVFMAHVHECAGCAAELRLAQTVQDTLLDLPPVDCPVAALEPVQRLLRENTPAGGDTGFWSGLGQWLGSAPASLRYALPAVVVVVIVTAVVTLATVSILMEERQTDPAIVQGGTPEYSPEEVVMALQQLNLAIDYLNEVSQRTEVMISDRFLITPLRETLDASFEQIFDADEEAPDNGPVF